MKKIIFLGIMIAGLFMQSCEKDKMGGTATEALAGEWYVTVDGINADGSIAIEDPYSLGHILVTTYNTASNVASEIWVDDAKHFWEFKAKAKADVTAGTFSAENSPNEYYECDVNILNGKVLVGAATTPSGSPATVSRLKYLSVTIPLQPKTVLHVTKYPAIAIRDFPEMNNPLTCCKDR